MALNECPIIYHIEMNDENEDNLTKNSETFIKLTLDKTFESQQTRQKLLKYVSYYKHEQTQESFEIRHLDERFRLNGPLKPISIPRQIKLHIYSLLRTPLVRGR